MPHSLSASVIASAVADLVSLLFVAAILAGLQQAFPRPHMRSWSWSWLAGAVDVACGILAAILPPLGLPLRWTLTWGILFSEYSQAAWLLVGTLELTRATRAPPRFRRIALFVPAFLALASATVVAAAAPLTVRMPVRFLVPAGALAAATAVAVTGLQRRPKAGSSVGFRLMTGALALYGLLQVHEMVIQLRWMLGFTPPGYPAYFGFVKLAIMTAFGLGAVLSLLDEERDHLRLAEEKFARVFRSSPDAIAVTLPLEGGLIVDVNEQFERVLGYSRAEAVGKTTLGLGVWADPSDRTTIWEEGQRLLVRDREVELRTKSGELRPFSLSAESFEVEGRMFAVAVARDITERTRAAAELRRSEEHLRLALDAAGMGTWELDATTGAVAWSEGSEAVLGVTRDRLPETLDGYMQLVHPDDRGALAQRLQERLRSTHDDLFEEHRLVGGDGRTRWLEGRARIERDSGGRPLLIRGTVVDVSLRKEADTRQRRLEADLRKARIMEELGSLVAGVAHEARNPLFSISAALDAMEAELRSHPEFNEYAALLRSEVGRLTRLTQDLLDYGKPSLLQRGPAELADVVRRAARSCASLAGEQQVRVEIEIAPGVPSLHIDAAQMERACENLVTNALQHAPAGSVVRLGGRVAPDHARPVVLLTVEDEGPGLPAEDLERIFEPFFTRRSGGTGLGLSIVQRVVEAHGGEVEASNRAEGGACFTVRLPLDPGAPGLQEGA
jgi:PAS domain S-box-containing protein